MQPAEAQLDQTGRALQALRANGTCFCRRAFLRQGSVGDFLDIPNSHRRMALDRGQPRAADDPSMETNDICSVAVARDLVRGPGGLSGDDNRRYPNPEKHRRDIAGMHGRVAAKPRGIFTRNSRRGIPDLIDDGGVDLRGPFRSDP